MSDAKSRNNWVTAFVQTQRSTQTRRCRAIRRRGGLLSGFCRLALLCFWGVLLLSVSLFPSLVCENHTLHLWFRALWCNSDWHPLPPDDFRNSRWGLCGPHHTDITQTLGDTALEMEAGRVTGAVHTETAHVAFCGSGAQEWWDDDWFGDDDSPLCR